MREINIGFRIATKRKERNITQEELANFLCVSKPAVSKWESGQSYPDITLLPILATYFNTSVDELIGYEPQMSKEDIKNLYKSLSSEFAIHPFETVYLRCNEYAKKYYSCWGLQFHIGVLLINHVNLAEDKEKILLDARDKFQRVINESNNINLARQAIYMQSLCYIMENKPKLAIDLLSNMVETPMSFEILLASSYQMEGDNKKAISLLQEHVYHSVIGIIAAGPQLMMLYLDNPSKSKDCYERIMGVADIFGVRKMHPFICLPILSTASQIYIMQGDNNGALDMLEEYVKLIKCQSKFPVKLQGNDFFDSIDEVLDSLDLGTQAPRSEEIIKQSLKDSIINNLAFEGIKSEVRYQRLIKSLETL